jgi:hypothetical protein
MDVAYGVELVEYKNGKEMGLKGLTCASLSTRGTAKSIRLGHVLHAVTAPTSCKQKRLTWKTQALDAKLTYTIQVEQQKDDPTPTVIKTGRLNVLDLLAEGKKVTQQITWQGKEYRLRVVPFANGWEETFCNRQLQPTTPPNTSNCSPSED